MLDHVHLAKWADLAILCPASASTINRLAAGIADDAVGSLFLAYDLSKPYLVAPAMNQEMYRHPATQSALARLREWGAIILDTDHGRQACGDVGPGRLLDPERVFQQIADRLPEGDRR
jgi:phosphopantothenoylcysteine synthetase/decarboxylase